MKKIEPKIGEEFEMDGKHYICKKAEGDGCFDCEVEYHDCSRLACGEYERKDGVDVFFEEVEEKRKK